MTDAHILHYQEHGSGPVVVLLHGFISNSNYWNKITPSLMRKHRVIAIDLLGFGNSPKPGRSKYDYAAQLNSIEATLKAANVIEPFTLVGHSMGALLSLRYARQHKERVSKLVLVNMPVWLDYNEAREEVLGTNVFYRIGLRTGTHTIAWPIFKVVTALQLLSVKSRHNARIRYGFIFASTGASRLRSLRNVIFNAKAEADLMAVEVQTVLISGIHDRASYIRNIAQLRFSGNVRIQNILGGHHLPMSTPEAILLHI